MVTTNLFVIANVKQLRTGGSFRILLPFFRIYWCVGILNSAIFKFSQSGWVWHDFGGPSEIQGGGLNHPTPPPRYATAAASEAVSFKMQRAVLSPNRGGIIADEQSSCPWARNIEWCIVRSCLYRQILSVWRGLWIATEEWQLNPVWLLSVVPAFTASVRKRGKRGESVGWWGYLSSRRHRGQCCLVLVHWNFLDMEAGKGQAGERHSEWGWHLFMVLDISENLYQSQIHRPLERVGIFVACRCDLNKLKFYSERN